jgi:hypothetical protein
MSDTPRNRGYLALHLVRDFALFLSRMGWKEEPLKGDTCYQLLRMRHWKEKDPLIVYQKGTATKHATVYGLGADLAKKFVRERQALKERARKDDQARRRQIVLDHLKRGKGDQCRDESTPSRVNTDVGGPSS